MASAKEIAYQAATAAALAAEKAEKSASAEIRDNTVTLSNCLPAYLRFLKKFIARSALYVRRVVKTTCSVCPSVRSSVR